MKTLIVPDVHEDYKTLLRLVPKMDEADRVILLGDFWDAFHPEGHQGLIATWVLEKLYDPKYTFLWGNHDCHYAFMHPFFRCTGYHKETQRILNSAFTTADWSRFIPFTTAGPFLISHAGFNPATLHLQGKASNALDLAFAGEFHDFWMPGRARGGSARYGGPTWLDWNEEFTPIPTVPQIVGHTRGSSVRHKEGNWCIDSGLQHVVWIEEASGEMTIERI